MSRPRGAMAVALAACLWLPSVPARAAELTVGPSGDYAGIQDALDDATDGDVVTVEAGTYAEALETRAPGVTLRAAAGGAVVVEADGRVLRVSHPRFRIEGMVLDGGFGDRDAVNVDDGADEFSMVRCEVRNAGRDCIDMAAVSAVTIESSLIHHCLRSTESNCASDGCRVDAHGVVGGPVQGLTIRDTEIHTFSGDAVQLDPGRSEPIWTDLVIEGCRFWLEPLPEAVGGFAAGVVPGENAVDTKTPDTSETPARLTIVDTVAWGFRDGLIGRMSVFNLKENVVASIDRVTVYDSQIAFRLRGATSSRPRGARVTIDNAVLWSMTDAAVRYEDDIEPVTLRHVTLGGDIASVFDRAGAPDDTIRGTNVLALGDALPAELGGGSNLAVAAGAFVDAAGHDYHLAAGAPAIDAGEDLGAVPHDRDGVGRPQGAGWDVGAYERCEGGCAEVDAGPAPADAGTARRDGGPAAGSDGGPGSADGGTGGGGDEDGGCGCRTVGARGAAGSGLLLALVAAGILRRRGRRP